jgi:hypothetical protein
LGPHKKQVQRERHLTNAFLTIEIRSGFNRVRLCCQDESSTVFTVGDLLLLGSNPRPF